MKFFQSTGNIQEYEDDNFKSINISKLLFVFFPDISQLKCDDDGVFTYPDNLNTNFSEFLNCIITKDRPTSAASTRSAIKTPTTTENIPKLPLPSNNLTQTIFPIKLSNINYRKSVLSYLLYSSLYGNTVCYSLGMINQKKIMKAIPLLKLLSVMNNYKVKNTFLFIYIYRLIQYLMMNYLLVFIDHCGED